MANFSTSTMTEGYKGEESFTCPFDGCDNTITVIFGSYWTPLKIHSVLGATMVRTFQDSGPRVYVFHCHECRGDFYVYDETSR